MKCEQLTRYSGFISLALFTLFWGCAPEQVHHGSTPADETTPSTAGDWEQETPPRITESSTIEDYLEYAALNNPGLQAAFNKWKAEMEGIAQASSLPDPKLSFRYYIEEVETRVGPQRRAIGLSQMFPWFGKLNLRGGIAGESANIARQRYEGQKRKLFLNVKSAYYEYYYLGRAIAVVEGHFRLVKGLEETITAHYKTATAGYSDMIRLQVELGKLEDRVSTLLDLRKPTTARLNAALNRPIDSELPIPKKRLLPRCYAGC